MWITVVVPTYQRPKYLLKCLGGLIVQSRIPDEVVVVTREDDHDSHRALQDFIEQHGSEVKVVSCFVSQPGFLPPVQAGINAAGGDIIAFLDDDAEPFPDWLERLEAHYSDPRIGGVGGRCVNMDGERECLYPVAAEVGRFYWFGRAVGNMYRDVEGTAPRRVDFFMGANMSYRRDVLQRVCIDPVLNRNVAFLYELDVGLQVKALGYELIYEPMARAKHFSASRETVGMRQRTPESVYLHSHNLLYITLKHAHGVNRWLAAAYSFLVGDRMGWGLLAAAVETVTRRNLKWYKELPTAFHGKMDALRQFRLRKELGA